MSINLHARQHPILTLPPAGATREQQVWERAISMCDEIQLPEVLPLPTSDAWSALRPDSEEAEAAQSVALMIDAPISVGETHDGVGSMLRKLVLARAKARVAHPGETLRVARLQPKLWHTNCSEEQGETRLSAVYGREFLCHSIQHTEKCAPLRAWFNDSTARCWGDAFNDWLDPWFAAATDDGTPRAISLQGSSPPTPPASANASVFGEQQTPIGPRPDLEHETPSAYDPPPSPPALPPSPSSPPPALPPLPPLSPLPPLPPLSTENPIDATPSEGAPTALAAVPPSALTNSTAYLDAGRNASRSALMFGKPPVGVLPTPDKSSTAMEQPVPAQWRDDIIDGGGLTYPNMTDRVQQQQQEAVRAEEQAAAECALAWTTTACSSSAAMATAIAKELKRLHGVPFVPPTAFRDNLGADTACGYTEDAIDVAVHVRLGDRLTLPGSSRAYVADLPEIFSMLGAISAQADAVGVGDRLQFHLHSETAALRAADGRFAEFSGNGHELRDVHPVFNKERPPRGEKFDDYAARSCHLTRLDEAGAASALGRIALRVNWSPLHTMECFRRADALVMPSPSSFSALPMALMDETAPALQMYPEDTLLGEGDLLLEQLVRQPWYKKRVFDGSRLKEFVEAAAAAASRPLRDLDAAEANR